MAQISTVEGINRLNATLGAMAKGSDAAQSLQASSLVGRQVMAPGSAMLLADGAARGGYQLEGNADGVTLTVSSASGVVVHRAELGPQSAGLHAFQWDGMSDSGAAAASGAYTFEISARSGGKGVGASALMLGRVDGVTPGADGTKLALGGLGSVGLADIRHIF
jgi:flagellar basal-body rod modification protein FlgD